eukprot:9195887-Pyramimonas_sp.AAC.1
METQAAVSCLHRAIREQPSAPVVLEQEGHTILHPKDILDVKRLHWEKIWSPPEQDSQGELEGIFEQIRERVQEERLPDLTAGEL